jgi:hypothetical protein
METIFYSNNSYFCNVDVGENDENMYNLDY